jgi:hypothetical protein
LIRLQLKMADKEIWLTIYRALEFDFC